MRLRKGRGQTPIDRELSSGTPDLTSDDRRDATVSRDQEGDWDGSGSWESGVRRHSLVPSLGDSMPVNVPTAYLLNGDPRVDHTPVPIPVLGQQPIPRSLLVPVTSSSKSRPLKVLVSFSRRTTEPVPGVHVNPEFTPTGHVGEGDVEHVPKFGSRNRTWKIWSHRQCISQLLVFDHRGEVHTR